MSFLVGDAVVHPHYGEAIVAEVNNRIIRGQEIEFIKLKLKKSQRGLTVEIPASSILNVGVRSAAEPDAECNNARDLQTVFNSEGLGSLFIDQLGWDAPSARIAPLELNETIVLPELVAELKGYRVVAVPLDFRPTRQQMSYLDGLLKVLSPERLVIFQAPDAWFWSWPTSLDGKIGRGYLETLPKVLPENIAARLSGLKFTLAEHRQGFTLAEVRGRALHAAPTIEVELDVPNYALMLLERISVAEQINVNDLVRRYIARAVPLLKAQLRSKELEWQGFSRMGVFGAGSEMLRVEINYDLTEYRRTIDPENAKKADYNSYQQAIKVWEDEREKNRREAFQAYITEYPQINDYFYRARDIYLAQHDLETLPSMEKRKIRSEATKFAKAEQEKLVLEQAQEELGESGDDEAAPDIPIITLSNAEH